MPSTLAEGFRVGMPVSGQGERRTIAGVGGPSYPRSPPGIYFVGNPDAFTECSQVPLHGKQPVVGRTPELVAPMVRLGLRVRRSQAA